MKKKKEICVYLAGAIEKAPDGGKKWRKKISKFLKEELGHHAWDPTVEEYHFLTNEEKKYFRIWKTENRERFLQVVRKIIDKDLFHLLNKTDYVIAFWDEHVLGGGGTHGEITLCYHFKIPVYLVLGMNEKDVSSWIVGCSTETFKDFKSLKKFLINKYK